MRLLQVDTPEVGPQPECGGAEASARLVELLPVGAPVRVAADVDLLDRYGRTLLLVWDERGRSVQEVLVAEGLATVLHVGRNDRGLTALEAAEAGARADGRGSWSACPEPEALPTRAPRLPDTGLPTWLGAGSG